MNIFARKIGFFYKNREWAEEIFNKIVESTDGELIERMVKSKTMIEIVYKDGTVVKFIEALEKARGYRFNMIYLEPTIDYEYYSTVAMPYLLTFHFTGPAVAYVLSDSKALYREWGDDSFCVEAGEYYRKKDCRQKASEAIAQLGLWAVNNPEVARHMRKYIDSHETLEEMEDSIDAALKRAKKYAPAMIHILDDCK